MRSDSTFVDGDGAIPGRRLVGVTASRQGTRIKHGEPEVIFLVPEVYATPSSSGPTAEVQDEGKNEIEIKIDSAPQAIPS